VKIYHERMQIESVEGQDHRIVGWGNQDTPGENLKDSGLDVIAADLPGSKAGESGGG